VSKTYAIEYPWRDGTYVVHIQADTPDEAMDRVRQASNLGKCLTPHGTERVAINTSWGAGLEIWLRNLFKR
jgi:hypothetical protein